MNTQGFIRLRQLALAVSELARAEQQLCEVFDVAACHHDERVQRYGLENAVLTFGSTFIELLAPTRPDTAVSRFLERGKERQHYGAYMAIFDCSDLAVWRGNVDALKMRVINEREYARYRNFQLHPRDTGAALVEIHRNLGGDELLGHYEPGGDEWQQTIRNGRTLGITGIRLESPQPDALAARWSAMLGRPVSDADGLRIELDLGALDFGFSENAAEQVSEIVVAVRDVAAIVTSATEHGFTVGADWLDAYGVRFRLVERV